MPKYKTQKGFTLVELLIVIALIAILSVGVLATINPIEQRNKATDANTQNDAGEVLNAYERYFANANMYPWKYINSALDNDTEFGSVSNKVGFGLCTSNVTPLTADTPCSNYKNAGILISQDELKSSFLEKGYGKLLGTTGTNATSFGRLLYMYKEDATGNNSIYVCYVPQAKSNRSKTNNLKVLTWDGTGTAEVPNSPQSVSDAPDSAFDSTGSPVAADYDFKTPAKSLFKCVP